MMARRTLLAQFLPAMLGLSLAAMPVSAQEEPSYRYLSTNFSVTDVDMRKLLNRLGRVGVRIPFDVEGDVSARLQIQIPVNGLRDTQAYRFHGSITSKRLEVANLNLLNVQMEAVYRDGVLNLDPLVFQIPDPQANGLPPGNFRGTGRMELVPRGELALDLQLDAMPAPALNEIAGQAGLLTAGQFSGAVKGQVPAADVRDLAAWNLEGQFTGSALKAMGRELQKASFQFLAENGELRIDQLTATMAGAKLAGTATANLTGKMPYSSNLTLAVTDVSKLQPGLEAIQPSDPLQATANLSGTLSPATFLANGQATLPETEFGPLKVTSGRLDYSVTDKQFAISDLNLKLYQGAITGTATLPRDGETSAVLDLQLQPALSLDQLVEDLSEEDLQIAGQIAGNLKAQAPREKVSDLSAWDASAHLSIQEGTAWGLAIRRAAIQVLLQNNVVSISETGLTWANSALDASGQLRLADPQTFDAKVELAANDLHDLNQLSENVQLPVDVNGRLTAKLDVKGQLEEFQWQATGTVGSEQLQIDKVRVNSMTADIAATPQALSLKKFDLQLYEGKVTGQGQYPFEPQGAGNFKLDWQAINVGSLLQQYLETTTPVTGILSGQMQAVLGPMLEQRERQWTTQANFRIPTITIGEVEAGHLTGKLEYEEQRLDYKVTGKVFDGDFELTGELPAEDAEPPAEPAPADATSSTGPLPGKGRIELTNLQLQKVWRAFMRSLDAGNLAGLVKIEFQWSTTQEPTREGSGSVMVTNLTWNGRQISNLVEGRIQLRGHRIMADNIRGTVAGGQVEVSVVWDLKRDRSRLILVRARNLNLPFLAQFTPLPEGIIEGRTDMEARFYPGEIWRIDIHLRANRLVMQGVAISSLTLPIHGTILPSFERGDISLQSFGASLAGGRIQGQVAFAWGDRRRIDGELTFNRLNTKILVQQALGSDLPGDGHLSGTINLEGQNMTTWAATRMTIDAKLSRAQPRRLPVVRALQSVVQSLSTSQPVEEGQIKAVSSQSGLTIQSASLSGPTLELLIWGTVSPNRRLNLNALIRTGRRSIDRRIAHLVGGQLGSRLLAVLADQLIQVRITGTVRRPIVHVKPLSLISIKALQ